MNWLNSQTWMYDCRHWQYPIAFLVPCSHYDYSLSLIWLSLNPFQVGLFATDSLNCNLRLPGNVLWDSNNMRICIRAGKTFSLSLPWMWRSTLDVTKYFENWNYFRIYHLGITFSEVFLHSLVFEQLLRKKGWYVRDIKYSLIQRINGVVKLVIIPFMKHNTFSRTHNLQTIGRYKVVCGRIIPMSNRYQCTKIRQIALMINE